MLAQQPVLGYPRPLGARQVEQGDKQSGANAATRRDYIELCLIDSGAQLGSWTTIDAMTTDSETTVNESPLAPPTVPWAAVDTDRDTKLAVDQPSLLFASYDNPTSTLSERNSTSCSLH